MSETQESSSSSEAKAAFIERHNTIVTAKEERREANAAVTAARKALKETQTAPIVYKVVEWATENDITPAEAEKVLNEAIVRLQWIGYPINVQASLLEAPKMPNPKKAEKAASSKAAEEGLRAGRDGDPETANPYPAETVPHETYAQSYRRGLEERATAAKMQTSGEEVYPIDIAERRPTAKRRSAGTALERARAHLDGGASQLPN